MPALLALEARRPAFAKAVAEASLVEREAVDPQRIVRRAFAQRHGSEAAGQSKDSDPEGSPEAACPHCHHRHPQW
jgi:hypothetical protein